MLPILRILPVGGVLLAILLLALALGSPGGSRAQFTPNMPPVRGAMIERHDHPEWRQFLILAAIQRAGELTRLRELPDTPVQTDAAPAAPEVASLPTERSDSDPQAQDEAKAIVQPPAATIPIDIGESSSTELPIAAPEETPPEVKTPQRAKSRNESRIRRVSHARRARALANPPPPLNFFDLLFGNQQAKQTPQTQRFQQHHRLRHSRRSQQTQQVQQNQQVQQDQQFQQNQQVQQTQQFQQNQQAQQGQQTQQVQLNQQNQQIEQTQTPAVNANNY